MADPGEEEIYEVDTVEARADEGENQPSVVNGSMETDTEKQSQDNSLSDNAENKSESEAVAQ